VGAAFDPAEPFGCEPFGRELKVERLRVERLVAGQPRNQMSRLDNQVIFLARLEGIRQYTLVLFIEKTIIAH